MHNSMDIIDGGEEPIHDVSGIIGQNVWEVIHNPTTNIDGGMVI